MYLYIDRHYYHDLTCRLFAKDLVETTHLYIRAMEKWCNSQGKVLVQKKKRKAVRTKKKRNTAGDTPPEEPKLTQVIDNRTVLR